MYDRRTMNRKTVIALWVAQALLAALFLFSGCAKLLTPAATLEQQAHMSATFLRFIGVCEILGALGLVLPGLLHVREELTPIAAGCLAAIMVGAVVTTLMQQPSALAAIPAVVGVLCIAVAYGRTRVKRQPA